MNVSLEEFKEGLAKTKREKKLEEEKQMRKEYLSYMSSKYNRLSKGKREKRRRQRKK